MTKIFKKAEALEAIKNDCRVVSNLSKKLLNDREIALALVSESGVTLGYLNDDFKKDKEIALIAIENGETAFFHVDDSIKTDEDVRSAAYSKINNAQLPKLFKEELINQYLTEVTKLDEKQAEIKAKEEKEAKIDTALGWDKKVGMLENLLKIEEKIEEKTEEKTEEKIEEKIEAEKIELLATLKHSLETYNHQCEALRYADKRITDDKEFILKVVKQNGLSLRYVNETLSNDKEVVLAAINQNGDSFCFAHPDLKKDRELALIAVSNEPHAIEGIHNDLKKDKEIALIGLDGKGWRFQYIAHELRFDKEFVLAVVKSSKVEKTKSTLRSEFHALDNDMIDYVLDTLEAEKIEAEKIEIKKTKGKHSKYAPSSANRWLRCPASLKYHVNQPYNFLADQGTKAHKWAETLLTLTNLVKYNILKDKLTKDVGESSFEAINDAVNEYMDYIDTIVGESEGMMQNITIEARSHFNKYVEGGFGTMDALILDLESKIAHIIDFKYGLGAVEVIDNDQLKMYALGYLSDLRIETFTLHIVQPRIGVFESWSISRVDLEKYGEYVKSRVALTKLENPPFTPSKKACQWCSYKPKCKALLDNINGTLNSYPSLQSPKTHLSTIKVEEISNDNLGKILENKTLIENFLKSVSELSLEKLQKGEKVPGFKLVKYHGRRSYNDNAEIILHEKLGDKAYIKKIIGISEAERKLGKKEFKTLDLTTKSETKGIMVSVDDKRPEVTNDKEAKRLDYMKRFGINNT